MAKATTLIDDMDGSANAKERTFAIAGISYSIDLNDAHWQLFLDAVEPFRSRASVARKTRRSTYPTLTKGERVKIRAWANENGYDLAERGRFPTDLVERYFAECTTSELVSVGS